MAKKNAGRGNKGGKGAVDTTKASPAKSVKDVMKDKLTAEQRAAKIEEARKRIAARKAQDAEDRKVIKKMGGSARMSQISPLSRLVRCMEKLQEASIAFGSPLSKNVEKALIAEVLRLKKHFEGQGKEISQKMLEKIEAVTHTGSTHKKATAKS